MNDEVNAGSAAAMQRPTNTSASSPAGSVFTSATLLASARLNPAMPGAYAPEALKLPFAV